MSVEPLTLFNSLQQRALFFIALLCILCFNLSWKYAIFLDFKNEEFVTVQARVMNIYPKPNYQVVKFETSTYSFFTSMDNSVEAKQLEEYELTILTHQVSFIDFLKGFYTKSFLPKLQQSSSIKHHLHQSIHAQHDSAHLQSLFLALFLAIPLQTELRDFFAYVGISHLIAISGFHLGVLSACFYFFINTIYKPLHQRYLLCRNRRFDVMVVTTICLFGYLLLTGIVPSLLRAFLMFCMALVFLRCHLKLLSYEVLLLCLSILLALFPNYLFSLGLWFSFAAVFYIYLFLQYFTKGSKVWLAIWFNIWIFLMFNPIVHYFFEHTSYVQLLSPMLTILFTIFYPLELLLHLVGYGMLLDEYLLKLMAYEITTYSVITPTWFLVVYVVCSLGSIFKKEVFYGLNGLMIGFNVYLYL